MKTAWFLGHRIRLAMDPGADRRSAGQGKTVEADETEMDRSRKTSACGPGGRRDNVQVLSLVERGGASAPCSRPRGSARVCASTPRGQPPRDRQRALYKFTGRQA